MMHSGMFTPPDGPHHSSTIQSLYAFTHASPRSWSGVSIERLAAEAGERGERQRAVDPVEREVLDALVAVVATGAHLVIGDRGHDHLRRVELREVAVGRRVERDRDEPLLHVDQLAVEVPGVAPRAVGVFVVRVLRARLVLERAPLLALDARPALAPLLGQPRLPHVRRLDHVVVDADDLRQLTHASPSARTGRASIRASHDALRIEHVEMPESPQQPNTVNASGGGTCTRARTGGCPGRVQATEPAHGMQWSEDPPRQPTHAITPFARVEIMTLQSLSPVRERSFHVARGAILGSACRVRTASTVFSNSCSSTRFINSRGRYSNESRT